MLVGIMAEQRSHSRQYLIVFDWNILQEREKAGILCVRLPYKVCLMIQDACEHLHTGRMLVTSLSVF